MRKPIAKLTPLARSNDTLLGGEGADRIWGNGGNDTLLGGAGDDELSAADDDYFSAFGSGNYLGGGAGDVHKSARFCRWRMYEARYRKEAANDETYAWRVAA